MNESVYYTQPPTDRSYELGINDMNNISLRRLKQRNKQASCDVTKMQNRIKFFRVKDQQQESKQLGYHRRRSMLETIRRQYEDMKDAAQSTRKKQEDRLNKATKKNAQELFTKNTLRVFNAEMQKTRKIKDAARMHQDLQREMVSQIMRDTEAQRIRLASQGLRRQLKEGILKRKLDQQVRSQHYSHRHKLQRFYNESRVSEQCQRQIWALRMKEKETLKNLVQCEQFRDKVQGEYEQVRGYQNMSVQLSAVLPSNRCKPASLEQTLMWQNEGKCDVFIS